MAMEGMGPTKRVDLMLLKYVLGIDLQETLFNAKTFGRLS